VAAVIETDPERLPRRRRRSAKALGVVRLGVALRDRCPRGELGPALVRVLRVGTELAAARPFHVDGTGVGQDDQPAIEVADPHELLLGRKLRLPGAGRSPPVSAALAVPSNRPPVRGPVAGRRSRPAMSWPENYI
jgi:hypothetical protein